MKRYLVLLAALMLVAALPAMAQNNPNYHYNENINCSDCHSMHASAHNNLTDGSEITTPNDPGVTPVSTINPYYPAPQMGAAHGGREYLLKADDVCASCHKDQTFAPDVYEDNLNGYIRSAGGVREQAVGTAGGGHLIGTTNRPPGYSTIGTADVFPTGSKLECYSCHSPHGGTNFRNLVPYSMRGAVGSANAGKIGPTVDKTGAATWGTVDVDIANGNAYVFGTGNMADYYGRNAVTYASLSTSVTYNGATSSNRMDQFCGVCHGNFHGGVAGDNTTGTGALASEFVKHPTGIVTIGSYTTAGTASFVVASNLKVYQKNRTGLTAGADSPGCLSCHKAHGNNNPFGLVYPSVTAANTTEEGEGVFKTLCKSCHGMGGSITAF